MSRSGSSTVWVLEDGTNHKSREDRANGCDICLSLYRVEGSEPTLADQISYKPGTLKKGVTKAGIALDLLESAKVDAGIVVGNHRLGSVTEMVTGLSGRSFDFVIEIHPATELAFLDGTGRKPSTPGQSVLSAEWKEIDPDAPNSKAVYTAASLGRVDFSGHDDLTCFAVARGGLENDPAGLHIGIASLPRSTRLDRLAHLLEWTRWLRPIVRRSQRVTTVSSAPRCDDDGIPKPRKSERPVVVLPARSNIVLACRQDEKAAEARATELRITRDLRGRLLQRRKTLNVVELFAGGGGMGLGLLLASRKGAGFRIISSAEINPIYANTLRTNHDFARVNRLIPSDAVPETIVPTDLRTQAVADQIADTARQFGGVDVLIGGPPCQGFSCANRNSWSSKNPNNRLVDTFIDYVTNLQPLVLVMENVQGILWTPRYNGNEGVSVADHVVRSLSTLGYRVYPKLLDAVWYGVPQHRSRFFLVGIHKDLGYAEDHFGAWGPFPEPTHGPGTDREFVNVRQAISDLPRVLNGAATPELPYEDEEEELRKNEFLRSMRTGAPTGIILDHIVSRQAEYVLDRYKKIPQGGNWASAAELFTNYADVERTHSNIYRRLKWQDPSITIGHYRKSMIIHPSQNRGLSLREAARLQSFPDWFRFSGGSTSISGGISHKQQQLANAVCPLVTKAVAEFILNL